MTKPPKPTDPQEQPRRRPFPWWHHPLDPDARELLARARAIHDAVRQEES